MRERSFFKDFNALIPLIFSGLLCIGLVFFLWQRAAGTPAFVLTLNDLATTFLSISGFIAAIIMVYLASAVSGLKNIRETAFDHLGQFTQKMHAFRNIIDLLFRSKIWLPGLREYIDEEFAGLTFYEVKEFYKGKSKLAIEFLQETHNYADTENLYLELKSLLMSSVREKRIPENISYPKVYDKELVEKWLEHKCGSGLWYYFGYKYGIFKEALDINSVFERHQEKIMTLANSIDSEAFEDSSFNEVFLSKLGEYMTKEVIPQLHQFQAKGSRGMPQMMRYLYFIFLILVLSGVLLPIAYLLFTLPILTLITSISVVSSTIFFIAVTFYQFLSKEIRN